MITPDEELVKRIASRDQQAFLDLYDRYVSRIYALVLRIVGDEPTAEEVTQDVFLKLWTRSRRYLYERGVFSTWLLTIAKNTALDRLRLERRRPMVNGAQDPEQAWTNFPNNALTSEETRWRSLHFILQSLPPEQRLAIELAFYQGMSHREIAEYLGWSLGTVKSRLRSGMEHLRQQWLKKESFD